MTHFKGTLTDDAGKVWQAEGDLTLTQPTTAPVASITGTPSGTSGVAPLTVKLSGRSSTGQSLTFKWFENGTVVADTPDLTVALDTVGRTVFRLVVTDTSGRSASAAVAYTVTEPPPPPPSGGFKVSGNQLLDPRGVRFVPRGVEAVYFQGMPLDQAARAGKTGLNCVRLLFYLAHPKDFVKEWQPWAVNQIGPAIDAAIAAGVAPDVCISGGKAIEEYERADVKAQLLPRQDRIAALHILGEAYETDLNAWVARAKQWIARARAAGYTCPLTVMPVNGGRNLKATLTRGQEIVDSDPLKNTFMGWQAYWNGGLDETGSFYQNLNGMTLRQGFQAAHDAPFYIQAGLCSEPGSLGDQTVGLHILEHQERCFTLNLGYLVWSWDAAGGVIIISGQDAGPPYGTGVWNTGGTPGEQIVKGQYGLATAVKANL